MFVDISSVVSFQECTLVLVKIDPVIDALQQLGNMMWSKWIGHKVLECILATTACVSDDAILVFACVKRYLDVGSRFRRARCPPDVSCFCTRHTCFLCQLLFLTSPDRMTPDQRDRMAMPPPPPVVITTSHEVLTMFGAIQHIHHLDTHRKSNDELFLKYATVVLPQRLIHISKDFSKAEDISIGEIKPSLHGPTPYIRFNALNPKTKTAFTLIIWKHDDLLQACGAAFEVQNAKICA